MCNKQYHVIHVKIIMSKCFENMTYATDCLSQNQPNSHSQISQFSSL